ncbi:ABC transporter permease [Rhizohabitans arisaemae]|uniref:ABC transporter permease n=1 Tax=Rhizohabitans arisaemae TaxID=2720610 RepID=UPI0024B1D4AA|nr:ABC transporter permease [Rhizohabitans arisaemae]
MLVWQLVAQQMSAAILPTPQRTVNALIALIERGELQTAWGQSAVQVAVAMVLSALLGVGLGVLFGWYRKLDQLFSPLFGSLFLMPRVALIPLIALWFGLQDVAKVMLIMAFSFFEIFFTVRNGVKSVESEYVDVARAYCVPQGRTLRTVVMPAIRPYIITGLRLGLVYALVGVVLAGFFLEANGIGGMIYDLGSNFRTAELMAALFSVMVVGLAVNLGLRQLETRLTPWQVSR